MIGQTFGWLDVIGAEGRYVDCICQCGRQHRATGHNVRRGTTSSCGCARRAAVAQKGRSRARHGHRRQTCSRTYRSWSSMMTRCFNPKSKSFEHYGGRGILVCERWRLFDNFLADMGERPAGMTIDRYPDRNGGYAPGNCRWATPADQSANTVRARALTHDGITDTVRGWARRLGITQPAMQYRLKHMPLAKALTAPRKEN